MGDFFIHLDSMTAFQVALLGLVGGTLSGFIGSGGAFFMTPGMMNLGVPGVVAVGSNITHKGGKALVGARRHGEMGNVDRKLAIFMLLTAALGIRLAVFINAYLFGSGGKHGSAGADLYISVVFVSILFFVGLSMLRDVLRSAKSESDAPSRRLTEAIARLRLPPYFTFPVAGVRISMWVLIVVGLATGYLAGTIGVGGFIGVPAMIYVFGVPTAVATGTELFLALFMGVFGAVSYALKGMVDIRLALLLYSGSLIGIHIGAYGVKVVKEVVIRLVTSLIILVCVASRAVAIPAYLRRLGWLDISSSWDGPLNTASKVLLFAAGLSGCLVIFFYVIRAYRQRMRVRSSLQVSTASTKQAGASAE